MQDYSYIKHNLEKIRENINNAKKSAPNDDEVTLLLATKYATAEEINAAAEYGVCDIGENRVQQLLEKYDALNKEKLNIHFIGTLQKNKVKYICDKVVMIHSVDSIELAKEIDRQCKKIGKVMDILVEVNIGDEESKSGVSESEVCDLIREISSLDNVFVRGIMTMAPKCEEKEDFRKYFKETYKIFLEYV